MIASYRKPSQTPPFYVVAQTVRDQIMQNVGISLYLCSDFTSKGGVGWTEVVSECLLGIVQVSSLHGVLFYGVIAVPSRSLRSRVYVWDDPDDAGSQRACLACLHLAEPLRSKS